jgi:hypothetical protein
MHCDSAESQEVIGLLDAGAAVWDIGASCVG